MMDWKPTPADLEWTRMTAESISIGGVWAVPASMSVWQRTGPKSLAIVVGWPQDPTNQKIAQCLKAIGWTVDGMDDDAGNETEGETLTYSVVEAAQAGPGVFFSCILKDGDIFAYSYGSTAEEAQARAETIVEALTA